MALMDRINEHFNPLDTRFQLEENSGARDALGFAGVTALAVAAVGYAYFGVPVLVAQMMGGAGLGFVASYQTGKDGYAYSVAAIATALIGVSVIKAIHDERFFVVFRIDIADIIRAWNATH